MPQDYKLDKRELFVTSDNRNLRQKRLMVYRLKVTEPCNVTDNDFDLLSDLIGEFESYKALVVGSSTNKITGTQLELLVDSLLDMNLRVNHEGFCYFPTRGTVSFTGIRSYPFYRINELFDWTQFNATKPDLTSTWDRCYIGRNEKAVDYSKMVTDLADYKQKLADKDEEIENLKKGSANINPDPASPSISLPPLSLANPDSVYRQIVNRRSIPVPSTMFSIEYNSRFWSLTDVYVRTLTPVDSYPGSFYQIRRIQFAGNTSQLDTGNWRFIRVKEYPEPIVYYAGDFGGYVTLGSRNASVRLPYTNVRAFGFISGYGRTPNTQYFEPNVAVLVGFGATITIARYTV